LEISCAGKSVSDAVCKTAVSIFLKKKIGREALSFSFHDRLIFFPILRFNSSNFHAQSQPVCLTTATTNLNFEPEFIHFLNLYKKVYILNLSNSFGFVKS